MGLLSGQGSGAYKSVERTNFIATAGQTTFTVQQGYPVGDIDVHLNGVRLLEGDDFYATNGSTIVLSSGAAANDLLQVVSYNQFSAANTYTKAEADNRYMVATGQTPMTSYLRTPNYGVSSWSDSATASLEASVGGGENGVGIKAFGRSVGTTGGDILYTTDTRGAGGRHRFGYWNGSVFTETAKIDALGRLQIPQQPSFSAYCMINETTTANTAAPFTATRFNNGGHFNTSTRRFTAPVSGRYMMSHYCNINGVSSGTGIAVGFFVNGTRASGWAYTTSNGTWFLISNCAVLNLNAGDYVFVGANSSCHWDYGSDAWGQFDGYLLG